VTTPLPPFTVAAAGYIEALADHKRRQTLEVIQAVRSDGWVRVVNTWIPVTGKVALRAGESVAVMWRNGTPQVAMMNQARRTGVDSPPIPVVGAVVEELFIATAAPSGRVEVWFRNDQQVTNLELRTQLDADPVYVKWGTRSDAFVVATAAHHYYICTLAGAENTVRGATPAVATIVRDEQPLDQNLPLVAAQSAFTLTGEEKYWTMSWDGINGSAGTLSEAAPNAISGSQSANGQLLLTRSAVELLTSPHILITDIQLDDRLDLLFVLSARLQSLPIVPAAAPAVFSDPIEQSDNSGSVERPGFAADGGLNSTVGTFGTHVFVVNVTTGVVLFKTCRDTIVQNVQTELTRLHTYRNVATSAIASLPAFAHTGKNGQLLDGWSVGTTPLDFTYTDLVSDFTNAALPGVASYVYDEFDATRTPYLDLTNLFGQETTTLTVGPSKIRAIDGSGNASQTHSIRATFAGRRIWQRKRYFMSGTYLPRRATASGFPLGLVLVKVKLEVRDTATTLIPAKSYGFFLHDLAAQTTTALAPLTPNFHGTQGVTHPVSHNTFVNSPETDGVFVVLGFNGTHLLWVHDHQDSPGGPDVVDILLTNVTTGASTVVLSGAGDVIVSGDPTYAPALQEFLLRNLQTLRPDFFYDPAETEAGHQFIRAWDAHGVPTLDATAADFPSADPDLVNLGLLQALPTSVVPQDDRVIAKNQGPVNIEDLTQVGPVWHVVQDAAVLGAELTTDP
jgi:hypothetical protein